MSKPITSAIGVPSRRRESIAASAGVGAASSIPKISARSPAWCGRHHTVLYARVTHVVYRITIAQVWSRVCTARSASLLSSKIGPGPSLGTSGMWESLATSWMPNNADCGSVSHWSCEDGGAARRVAPAWDSHLAVRVCARVRVCVCAHDEPTRRDTQQTPHTAHILAYSTHTRTAVCIAASH